MSERKPVSAAKVAEALATLEQWGREAKLAQGQQRPAPPAAGASNKAGADRD